MYSRSHCLVRMPIEAETRLSTRLENQRMLMRTERESARKGWFMVAVELATEIAFVASWADICLSRSAAVSSGSSWSNL